MTEEDWALFNDIIDEFEGSYRATNTEDGVEESLLLRLAYYSACLTVLRTGGKMKSAEVQHSLEQYYSIMLSEGVKEVSNTWLTGPEK